MRLIYTTVRIHFRYSMAATDQSSLHSIDGSDLVVQAPTFTGRTSRQTGRRPPPIKRRRLFVSGQNVQEGVSRSSVLKSSRQIAR